MWFILHNFSSCINSLLLFEIYQIKHLITLCLRFFFYHILHIIWIMFTLYKPASHTTTCHASHIMHEEETVLRKFTSTSSLSLIYIIITLNRVVWSTSTAHTLFTNNKFLHIFLHLKLKIIYQHTPSSIQYMFKYILIQIQSWLFFLSVFCFINWRRWRYLSLRPTRNRAEWEKLSNINNLLSTSRFLSRVFSP